MVIFYKIGIFFYSLAIHAASLFHPKARLFVQGRRNLREGLPGLLEQRNGRKLLWVHCASVGEFEQGRPLIEEIKKRYPEIFVFLTFFSPSGYLLHKNCPVADAVSYLPEDTGRNSSRFLDTVCPDMAVFVKYEFWYGYLSGLRRRNIPSYLVSAIFRKNQLMTPMLKSSVRKFSAVFVQNEESASLVKKAGVSEVYVAGDTRFDRVKALSSGKSAGSNPIVEKFADGNRIWIAGSTHDQDEIMIAEALPSLKTVKFVLVPHEVDGAHLSRIRNVFRDFGIISYSECAKMPSVQLEAAMSGARILLIDCVGILSSLYRYASFAYIGGGFTGKGIHNILEPATYGCPVVFGKNYGKFQEAVDLVRKVGAVSVRNSSRLAEILCKWIDNPESTSGASSVCIRYVNENLGATDYIISEIFKNR